MSLVLNFLRGCEDVFRRLDLAFQEATTVIPRRRWDITIEADLFEEIARIYGYDRLQ